MKKKNKYGPIRHGIYLQSSASEWLVHPEGKMGQLTGFQY
jgi:hypothetical protein